MGDLLNNNYNLFIIENINMILQDCEINKYSKSYIDLINHHINILKFFNKKDYNNLLISLEYVQEYLNFYYTMNLLS